MKVLYTYSQKQKRIVVKGTYDEQIRRRHRHAKQAQQGLQYLAGAQAAQFMQAAPHPNYLTNAYMFGQPRGLLGGIL